MITIATAIRIIVVQRTIRSIYNVFRVSIYIYRDLLKHHRLFPVNCDSLRIFKCELWLGISNVTTCVTQTTSARTYIYFISDANHKSYVKLQFLHSAVVPTSNGAFAGGGARVQRLVHGVCGPSYILLKNRRHKVAWDVNFAIELHDSSLDYARRS